MVIIATLHEPVYGITTSDEYDGGDRYLGCELANANLIACAPELLQSLEILLMRYRAINTLPLGLHLEAVNNAELIIAKAKGLPL